MTVWTPGAEYAYPPIYMGTSPNETAWLFDASTGQTGSASQKVSHIGFVKWSDGGTHNISKVHFPLGFVDAGGAGATFRVSLQDVSTASAPGQQDGVVDQSWTVAGTGLTANTWTTATLTATRNNVADGALLAIVFDWSVHSGSALAVIKGVNTTSKNQVNRLGFFRVSTAGQVAMAPVVVIESDTGVFGTLHTAFTHSATNTHAISTATNPKAMAVRIIPPVDMDCVGLWAIIAGTFNTADFNLVLMDASKAAIQTVAVDATQLGSVSITGPLVVPIPSTALTAGTTYYVAVVPTTAGNMNLSSVDFAVAAYADLMPGGSNCATITKDSSDVWSAVNTTRRLLAGIVFNGAGGGGATGLAQVMGGCR